jgi:ribonuclease HI
MSEWIETLLGLPQGSILSPILFIFFIMDLTSRIPNQISYADDLTLWIHAQTLEECNSSTLAAINNITKWCYKWGQAHHKTEVMLHAPTQQKGAITVNDSTGKPIPQVKTRKLLGVILDEELKFKEHISFISGRATSALHGVAPIIAHTSWETALGICKALVEPHLTRTYPVWCHSKASISSLEKVHRGMLMKATKVMAGTSTAALEVLTGTLPLDLALSEVLCQEIARLQAHSTDFPLLNLVINQCKNQDYLTSATTSPLHTMLRTVEDLGVKLTSIENYPVSSALNACELKRPVVHTGPTIGKPKKDWTELERIEACIHVLKEVLKVPEGCPIAFTDGSALGNPGPCGGAALLLMEGLNGPETPVLAAGAKYSTSYYGELIGLTMALMTIALEAVVLPCEVHCFIDCTSVINCAAGTCQATGNYETIQDIQNIIDFLERRQCRVHLHWSPSHIGISLNEAVDSHAKEAAEMARHMSSAEEATCKITIKQAKGKIRQATNERWQRQWDRNHCKTRSFLPRVKRPVKHLMPRQAEVARAGCISGHNRLAEHMNKLKLKPSSVCSCGTGHQNAEHVVMHCPLQESSRNTMIDKIERAFVKNEVPLQNRTLSFKDLMVPNYDTNTNLTVHTATAEFFIACTGVNF